MIPFSFPFYFCIKKVPKACHATAWLSPDTNFNLKQRVQMLLWSGTKINYNKNLPQYVAVVKWLNTIY